MILINDEIDIYHPLREIIHYELNKVIDIKYLYDICKKYKLYFGYDPYKDEFTVSDDWCLIF